MDKLIYDRTQSDVNRAILLNEKYNNGTITSDEKEEWENKLKGSYDYRDFNRIGEWTEYLSNLLNSFGYANIVSDVKKDWEKSDIPTSTQLNTILSNIKSVKTAFYALKSTPSLPSTFDKITYSKANDIEKILADIEYLLKSTTPAFIRCGVPQCGQDRMWQFRFLTKDSIALISDMSVNTNTAIEEISSTTTYSGDTTEVLDFPLAKDTDTLGGTMAQSNTGFNNLDEINGKGWN